MKKFSSFFTLNDQDLLSGLWVTVGGAVITAITPILESGSFNFDWKKILGVALSAGAAYLGQKLFHGTPKKIEIDPTKTEVIEKKAE